MMIQFVVPGPPHGKQRPTYSQQPNGRVVIFTPLKTKVYEELVRSSYMQVAGKTFFSGPVRVDIWAYYPIPKSATGTRRELMLSGQIVPEVKPDIDNVAKVILDGLNQTAYKDDAAVVQVSGCKLYTDREPCVVTRVSDAVLIPAAM